MAVDESERDDRLDRLVEEFAARLRRGEVPSLKEYADRYPHLADEIREVFPALVVMDEIDPHSGELNRSLGGRLALKVLPPAVSRRDAVRERFQREARAAARLHHTNIVPIFGVGEDQ